MSLMQMSFFGSVLILVTVILRSLLIHWLPKRTFMVLWMVALFRLLLPVALPSPVSIYTLVQKNAPMRELMGHHSEMAPVMWTATGVSGAEGLPGEAEGYLSGERDGVTAYPAEGVKDSASGKRVWALFSFWRILYLIGVLVCVSFFGFTYFRCYREFSTSLPAEEERLRKWQAVHPLLRRLSVRQSDRIGAPLSYGILRPVILMPKRTDWEDAETLAYVLEHEYVHIRRYDGVMKLVMVAALCLHWFNPLVWVMYILFNRDLELSCDETVVRRFGETAKASYAMTLIQMEEKKSGLAPFCNSFSKNAIEERITAIMKIKKNSMTGVLAAVMLTVGIGSAFATSAAPEQAKETKEAKETTLFDDMRQEWEETLAPYEPFGLTWEYHPDYSGNGLKMYFNGKEVRGISDEKNGIWITEHTGDSTYGTEATEVYAVYTNGVLSGLREASEEEQNEWSAWRRATSVAGDIVSQMLQDGTAEKAAGLNEKDFKNMVMEEVKNKVEKALADEFGELLSNEFLNEVLDEVSDQISGELEVSGELEAGDELEEELFSENEAENGQIYQNVKESDYQSLFALKTPDYKKQSVENFNQALLDWSNENFESHERIFEDISSYDYNVYLSGEERDFLEFTCVLSNEENFRKIISSKGKTQESGEYGGILLTKPQESEAEGLAWCDLWYMINYDISDQNRLTIGERDRCIRGVMEEIESFWAQTDLDTLVTMTKDEMVNLIAEIAEKYSNDLITIVIPTEQVSFEVMDEREEVRKGTEMQ